MVRLDAWKVIGVFTGVGLASGLGTIALINSEGYFETSLAHPFLGWLSAGLLLGLGLFLAAFLCRAEGWLPIRVSMLRSVLALMLLFPSSVVGGMLGTFAGLAIWMFLGATFPQPVGHNGYVLYFLAVMLGVGVGSVAAALCLALATYAACGTWDLGGFTALLISAGLTVMASIPSVIAYVHSNGWDETYFGTLYGLGNPLLAASVGYWLFNATQATARAEGPRSVHVPASG